MALSEDTLAARVRQSLDTAGMNQSDLAAAIGMDPTALSKALWAKRSFRPLELALIADELQVDLGALLADPDRRSHPVAMAARRQTDTDPAVIKAVGYAQTLLEFDDLLTAAGHPASRLEKVEVDRSGTAVEQGERLAERVGSALEADVQDLPVGLGECASHIEDLLGIDIAIEPLPRGLDGLSICRGDFRLALISSGIPGTRQRFTLAHEVAHLLFGDSEELRVDENVTGHKTTEEIRANAFAAALLMPREALRRAVPHGKVTETIVADLLTRYGVSQQSLAYRLHNIGVVGAHGRDQILAMWCKAAELPIDRTAGLKALNERRLPSKLLDRAIRAHFRGDISIRPLASLLNADADQLLNDLAPHPTARPVSDGLPTEMVL